MKALLEINQTYLILCIYLKDLFLSESYTFKQYLWPRECGHWSFRSEYQLCPLTSHKISKILKENIVRQTF